QTTQCVRADRTVACCTIPANAQMRGEHIRYMPKCQPPLLRSGHFFCKSGDCFRGGVKARFEFGRGHGCFHPPVGNQSCDVELRSVKSCLEFMAVGRRVTYARNFEVTDELRPPLQTNL